MDYEQIAQELSDFRIRSDFLEVQPLLCQYAGKAILELLRERNAALKMLHGECSACKHNAGWHNVGECATCKHENSATFLPEDCGRHIQDNWEWRGVHNETNL